VKANESDRLQSERAYHDDDRARPIARQRVGRFTRGAVTAASAYFWSEVQRCIAQYGARAHSVRVLDYGCGEGSVSQRLRNMRLQNIDGIDISPGMVSRARLRVRGVRFHVMNAENLAFQDATFDLVVGQAILHHLSLDKALPELKRVLKPTGHAVFLEPLGGNPAINLFRALTPKARTRHERPLREQDLEAMKRLFPGFRSRGFVFSALLLLPLRPVIPTGMYRVLNRQLCNLDLALWHTCPRLREYYWLTVVTL